MRRVLFVCLLSLQGHPIQNRFMLTLQKFVSAKRWFSLEYPRMWELEVIDNIPVFFDPIQGQGALQIFSAQLGNPRNIIQELEPFDFLKVDNLAGKMGAFLRNQNLAEPENGFNLYEKDQMSFIPHEYNLAGRFYMVCMLQKENIFLLALYNCSEHPTTEEANIVGKIVRSINITYRVRAN